MLSDFPVFKIPMWLSCFEPTSDDCVNFLDRSTSSSRLNILKICTTYVSFSKASAILEISQSSSPSGGKQADSILD